MSELKYGIIEVTTSCQVRCAGCYMVRNNCLNGSEMSLEQAIRVLDLCRDYRSGQELESMDILGGEPLLWPFLKEYIEELLRRGIQPWIFTNMVAIKPEMAKWLHERDVYITGKLNVSPNAPNAAELQAKLINSSAKMAQRMFRAVDVFRNAGYKAPMFKLENLVRRSNIVQVPAMYRWCLERSIDPDIELLGCGEELSPDYWEIGPNPKELAKMIQEIKQVRLEFDLENGEVLMPHIFGPCRFFESGLYFGVNGQIRACSNSNKTLAVVTDAMAVKKAFESELFNCRHTLAQEYIGEPCSTCDRWDRCKGGCRATAEGTGNPFAGYELCPVPYL